MVLALEGTVAKQTHLRSSVTGETRSDRAFATP